METNRTSTIRKLTSSALLPSKNNVAQQARLMDSAGTAWHAVKYGNLEMATKLFPSQCNVFAKGPVGDNVFHVAMLLNTPSTLAIAKYLVKLYGKTLVNAPYQERKHELDKPGQYEGETALHIAVVNRDFDMVKFLIQNGADPRARAYGPFFQQGSAVYFGEFPLSFAACTGQKDIVSYLKRHGARVNDDRDMCGNTALHMCIYHEQTDMYDHLVEFCGGNEHVRNNRSQTPLLLAASLGKLSIFQHIYNKRRKIAWAYGPVTSYSLSLREIDTVQDSNLPSDYVPSAMENIVRKGHTSALSDPLVDTLLMHKWRSFGMVCFLLQAGCYLIFLIVQTFLVWLHNDRLLYNTRSRQALEIVCLIFAALFFALELQDFMNWIRGAYERRRLNKPPVTFRPPMFPIPGEKYVAPDKPQSNTFRISEFKIPLFGDRSVAGPVAEGAEVPSASRTIPSGGNSGGQPSQPSRLGLSTSPNASTSVAIQMLPGVDETSATGVTTNTGTAAGGSSEGSNGMGPPGRAALQSTADSPAKPMLTVPVALPTKPNPGIISSLSVAHRPLTDSAATANNLLSGSRPLVASRSSNSLFGPPGATAHVGLASRGPLGEAFESALTPSTSYQRGLGNSGNDVLLRKQQMYAALSPSNSLPQAMSQLQAQLSGSIKRSGPGGHGSLYDVHTITVTSGLGSGHLQSKDSEGSGGAGHAQPSDIVSVGLGYSSHGAGAFTGSFAQSPSMQHTTRMIHGPTGPGGGPVGSAADLLSSPTMTGGIHGHGPRTSGGGGPGEINGEIKNRLRLGGGGDDPTNNSRRVETATASKRITPLLGGETVTVTSGGDNLPPQMPLDGQTGQSGPGGAEHEVSDEAGRHGFVLALIAFWRTARDYFWRQVADPITLIMVAHLALTFVHFITYATTYGGVDGSGPQNLDIRRFDDIVVSLMALTGWLSLWYFARGNKEAGLVAVVLETCILDVIKFIIIYIVVNIGFALAFHTLHAGLVAQVLGETSTTGSTSSRTEPFRNIGIGMMQLLRFMYGEADYDSYAHNASRSHEVFATIYFVAYIGIVLLLLLNLLTAMVVHTYAATHHKAEELWKLRWARYLLRVEARLPLQLKQRFRLGEMSYDPQLTVHVYNHMFEVVEEKAGAEDKEREAAVKAFEAALSKSNRKLGKK